MTVLYRKSPHCQIFGTTPVPGRFWSDSSLLAGTPLQLLCEVPIYWRELEQAVVHVDPDHPKQAQWVTCLVSMQAWNNWDICSFQELCTGPSDIVADDWQDNGPRDLVMVSLCIQITMIKCNCVRYPPYPNAMLPWSALLTTLTSANRSPHNTIQVVCNWDACWAYCQIL
jgi:hypothetical protein